MDETIWKKLPREIIICIIHCIGNLEDAKAWRTATQNDAVLYSTVLSCYWRHVSLSGSDLVLSGSDQPSPLIQQLICVRNGVQPARYIRDLNVMLVKANHWPDKNQVGTPDGTSIKTNLDALAPHLSAMESVYIQSPPAGTILSSLSKASHRVSILIIDSFCIQSERQVYNASEEELRSHSIWTSISSFQNLTSLDLLLVSAKEWTDIPLQVSTLKSLLVLKICPFDHPLRLNDVLPERRSPLNEVLNAAQQDSNLFLCLPSSLRSLIIRDLYYLGNEQVDICDALLHGPRTAQGPTLQELRVETSGYYKTPQILAWLPSARLKWLSFAPAIHRFERYHDDLIKTVDKVVGHHRETLEAIRLSDAYNHPPGLPEHFNTKWSGLFEITDLVLNYWQYPQDEECMEHHDAYQYDDSEEASVCHKFKHILFGCGLNVGRWGSRLQRIRIELECAAHEDVDRDFPLQDWKLPLLRLLIISPRPHCNLKEEEEEHQGILLNILKNATPNLRYISVCANAYWIDHRADSRDSWRIMPWTQALKSHDLKLRKQIASWLNADDRMFIDDNSRMNQERRGWFGEIGRTVAELYMGNFLVAHRCAP